MTLSELYRAAKTALEPVTEDPTFEAACLLEHFCGANRTELLLHGDKPAESEAEQAVLSALEKRKTGEPLQYLLGEWDFMSLTLSCGEGVLIPREDTAVLVEAVCKRLSKTENLPKGLDLCAGTGAVGLSIAKEAHAEVTEVELYEGDTQVSAVIKALEEGPEEKELRSVLPGAFRVKSAWLEEDVCYANLSSGMLETISGDGGLATALRALAKALCSLESVGEVRYLVDGEFADSYGSVNVARPYMR